MSLPSYFDFDHQRFQPWLGCFVTPSSSFGSLVASGLQASYQPPGAEGSLPSSAGFLFLISGQSVLVRSDNSTVVAYLNHDQGGTHSIPLCLETVRLLSWCCQERIVLSASHIPGRQNLVADFLSRGNFLPSEWSLHPFVFLQILRVSSPPPLVRGPVRILPQPPFSSLLFEGARSRRLGSGRFLNLLDRFSRVRVPPRSLSF